MARPLDTPNKRTTAPGITRMWQSMRILRRFTIGDLLTTAHVGESAAMKYVRALGQAGFLRLAVPRRSGHTGSRDVWLLVRGQLSPLAPIRRHNGSGVYDPNTQVLWNLQGLPVASADDHDAAARGLLAKLRDQTSGAPS